MCRGVDALCQCEEPHIDWWEGNKLNQFSIIEWRARYVDGAIKAECFSEVNIKIALGRKLRSYSICLRRPGVASACHSSGPTELHPLITFRETSHTVKVPQTFPYCETQSKASGATIPGASFNFHPWETSRHRLVVLTFCLTFLFSSLRLASTHWYARLWEAHACAGVDGRTRCFVFGPINTEHSFLTALRLRQNNNRMLSKEKPLALSFSLSLFSPRMKAPTTASRLSDLA